MRFGSGSIRGFVGFGLSLALATLSGCRGSDALIERLSFTPSTNLESVRVALEFNPRRVRSTLGGGFAIGDHGYLFLNSWTPERPFELGFELNTEVFQDPKYVDLDPTTVFPNGIPMGLPHAVVEVRADRPVGSRFDAYAYVDVLKQRWLGTAVILDFIDERNFPPGLGLKQVLARDAEGRPTALAAAFGPELDERGAIRRAGGLAVLADVRSLLDSARPGRALRLRPERRVETTGPAASRTGALELMRIERNLVEGLNAP
jgi:hypothetical protein